MKKTEGGQTILYVNKYFEKNLTTNVTTSYYYFGGKLVAMKESSANVTFVHQDSLGGTSVVSDANGALVSSIAYAPFGDCLKSQGTMPTDRLFTGQRLDATGLYYYGARYYDPTIGRFISADPIVQSYSNPQSLNRYTYVVNNPLKYMDPSGLVVQIGSTDVSDMDAISAEIDFYNSIGMELPQTLVDQVSALVAGMGQGGLDLLDSYEKLRNVAPELADYLEAAEDIVTISYSSRVAPIAGAQITQNSVGWSIDVSTGVIGEGTRITAARLGHEGFHAAERIGGMSGRSVANEAFAYSLGYRVADRLDVTPEFRQGIEIVSRTPTD